MPHLSCQCGKKIAKRLNTINFSVAFSSIPVALVKMPDRSAAAVPLGCLNKPDLGTNRRLASLPAKAALALRSSSTPQTKTPRRGWRSNLATRDSDADLHKWMPEGQVVGNAAIGARLTVNLPQSRVPRLGRVTVASKRV